MEVAKTKSHCNHCGCLTNHDVLAAETRDFEDEDGASSELFEMLNCCGCDDVSLRHTDKSSLGGDAFVQCFPPKIERRMPNWVYLPLYEELGTSEGPLPIPEEICRLMHEIFTAAANNSPRLVAMGARAVIEYVMIDKVGDQRSFVRNADAFEKAGYLSVRQRGHLDAIVEAGHASIHRGWAPPDSVVLTLLQITERIIEVAYLHDSPAERLAGLIPRRRTRT